MNKGYGICGECGHEGEMNVLDMIYNVVVICPKCGTAEGFDWEDIQVVET